MSPVIDGQGESPFQGRKGDKAPRTRERIKREPTEKSAFSLKFEILRYARNTARRHKRARDKVRARARARARAFGRSTNCFGRGLTSSTRGEFRRRTPSCILLGKVSKHI